MSKRTGKYIICKTCGKEKYYSGCCFNRKDRNDPQYCSKACVHVGLIGCLPWNKGTKGIMKAWNKGLPKEKQPCYKRCCSETTRQKMSKSNKGKHFDRKGKIYKEIYGIKRAGEIKIKQSLAQKGREVPLERRQRISKTLTGRKHSPEWFKKMCGRKLSSEHIKKSMRRRIPTSLEEKFMAIVYKHNLPYAYVGNGSFIIENFNPDFINISDERIIIEVYARMYKTIDGRSIEKWKKKRTEVFKKHGWNTIFFDEIELTEKNVMLALS